MSNPLKSDKGADNIEKLIENKSKRLKENKIKHDSFTSMQELLAEQRRKHDACFEEVKEEEERKSSYYSLDDVDDGNNES